MTVETLTFVDSNVLVYAHDDFSGSKQSVAQDVLELLWSTNSGTLSTQVLQEFYVTITRKLTRSISLPAARGLLSDYSAWPVQRLDGPDIVAASELEEEHSLSFWDALILVAARRSGASTLLTEDLNPGQTISGVRIENPFA